MEQMRKQEFNLGGEQSGHIVMTDFSTTGDGIVAALQFLSIMKQEDRSASSLITQFTPYPQKIKNVVCPFDANPLEDTMVKESIKRFEQELEGKGRILIRKSGTEPLIRVMVECEDERFLDKVINSVTDEIELSIKKS